MTTIIGTITCLPLPLSCFGIVLRSVTAYSSVCCCSFTTFSRICQAMCGLCKGLKYSIDWTVPSGFSIAALPVSPKSLSTRRGWTVDAIVGCFWLSPGVTGCLGETVSPRRGSSTLVWPPSAILAFQMFHLLLLTITEAVSVGQVRSRCTLEGALPLVPA